MNEEILEKARQLRAAGVPLAEIERYLQSKLGPQTPPDDTVEVDAGYPERLATTILEATQVVPGMKSFQAAMGALGSKFTDTPVSYRDARAGLEEQGDRMGGGRQFAAKVAAAPMLVPALAASGLTGASAAVQGAAIGGADQALDFDPDESMESRILRTGGGALIGGALGGTASGLNKLRKAPPGTVGKVFDAAMPHNIRRAKQVWRAMSDATATPVVRPKVRLHEASAPKVEGFLRSQVDNLDDAARVADKAPTTPRRAVPLSEQLERLIAPVEKPHAEGFLGNSLENVIEAAKGQPAVAAAGRRGVTPVQLEDLLEQASQAAPKSSHAPRHRTQAQFDYFAQRMAERAAEQGKNVANDAEPLLEDLLAASLEHIKKGGSLRQASDVASKYSRPSIMRSPNK